MQNRGDALRILGGGCRTWKGWCTLLFCTLSRCAPRIGVDVPSIFSDISRQRFRQRVQTSHRGTGMNALLIVHGIGEQRRGETTEKLIVGLKAAYGGAVKVEHDPDGYPATVTANGHIVRLYEVHWADVLSGSEVTRVRSHGASPTRWYGTRCGAIGRAVAGYGVLASPRPGGAWHRSSRSYPSAISPISADLFFSGSSTRRDSRRSRRTFGSRNSRSVSVLAPTPISHRSSPHVSTRSSIRWSPMFRTTCTRSLR